MRTTLPLFLSFLSLVLTFCFSAEGVVPSPIYGSVNVITGQFVEEVPQIVLHSPFELGLVRAYIGPDKENRPFVCWSMGASYLTLHQEESNLTFPSSFVVDEPSGSRTIYNHDGGRWIADLKGLSNQSGEPLQNAAFDRFQEKDGQTSFRMGRGDEEASSSVGRQVGAASRFSASSGSAGRGLRSSMKRAVYWMSDRDRRG